MKFCKYCTLLLVALFFANFKFSAAAAPKGRLDQDQLQQWLKQFPEADANKDGILSQSEALDYLQKMRGKKVRKNQAAMTDGEPSTGTKSTTNAPTPDFKDVHYGPHDRNVLDFWKAKSDQPTPVVVFIHGGGFVSGDKSKVHGDRTLTACLNAGVSIAAINYRFRPGAPIQDILRDCARAIQFIRSKSSDWNVDKTRIASYGGSAGAGTSLWLAFHDDLADPSNSDPVLRESSRLSCAGANSCQFSYDLLEWVKMFGEANKRFQRPDEAPAFYGLKTEDDLSTPAGQKIRSDCDMRGLITKDDAPVFVNTSQPGGEVTDRGHLLHHPKHALAIRDRCREIGVPVVAKIPGLNIEPAKDEPQDLIEFLFKYLKIPTAKAATR